MTDLSGDSDFVQLNFTTDPNDLADIAIAYLQSQWTGWVPSEAQLEVVLIEALAPLAANAANIAQNMPEAALIAFGTKLLNQPYNGGAPSYATVCFTFDASAPGPTLTIPAGSQLEIDGYAFQVAADTSGAPGTTVNATVSCTLDGSDSNGLTGVSISPISMPAFVVGMAVVTPSSNGVDEQSDDDYANQLSADRRLTSTAIVTLIDFELTALDQNYIGRAHADTTGPRQVTVTVLGPTDGVVSAPNKALLEAIYADPTQRVANVTFLVVDPTFETINIAYTVKTAPGYDPNDLITRINTALADLLSPSGWGVPIQGDTGSAVTTWISDSTVRYNVLIGLIENQPGCQYVVSMTLNGGIVDVVMSGSGVALPELGTVTGTAE
jgi:hypothetical protein